MGRLQIVRREIVRGAQGARGLPGVGSSAWLSDTPYTVGSVVQAPDGSWLTATTNHISGTNLDETELANWTALEVAAGSITEAALSEAYSAKSAQDTIESGRLHEEVLTPRFRIEKLRFGASKFEATSTATVPTKAFLGTGWPYWSLDKANEEHVTCDEFNIPKEWAAFEVHVKGSNGSAVNAGGVRVRVTWSQKGEGDDMSTTTQQANATQTVPAGLNSRISTKVLTTSTPVDTTKAHILKVTRVAADAADTLDNDWRFMGVELKATAFVTFEPEIPEPPEDLSGRTFTQEHNDDLAGLYVFQLRPPPPNDLDNIEWPYWPASAVATARGDFHLSTCSIDDWFFLWDMRRNYDGAWNVKPNQLISPEEKIGTRACRAVFTTKAIAMAATRAQARSVLGMSTADIESVWTAGGGVVGDIITEAAFRASPETYCTTEFTHAGVTYMVMTDKVVLPTAVLDPLNPEHRGLMLDYEPGDTRTTTETTTHITALATDCHTAGFELAMYGNPLTADNQRYDGLDSTNIRTIFDAIDLLEIKLWSKAKEGSIAASWAAQIALLGVMSTADWAKILIGFELGGVSTPGATIDDAEWVRAKLTEAGSDHPTKIVFWPNGAKQGGAPNRLVNQIISTICFGTLTPPAP